jgi:hypothetical protein
MVYVPSFLIARNILINNLKITQKNIFSRLPSCLFGFAKKLKQLPV